MKSQSITGSPPPILAEKHYDVLSAFTPESLLREARRQRALAKKGEANGTRDAPDVISATAQAWRWVQGSRSDHADEALAAAFSEGA